MPTGRAIEVGRIATADVRVVGVGKDFGVSAALKTVDLTVARGELLGLLGPSGSGKTTLLRVIAGLEIPDRGRVFFDGDDVTDRPVQDRGVGFVFQHYALFRHLSVYDNIAYGPRVRRHGRPSEDAIRTRVRELLELVQLEGLDKRFPSELSGGQRQRVALARALAVEPRVLLLDEPFGALDARVRRDLRRWLRDIHKRTGQTTIFVTHDQDEALELSDRVAILNLGRLEQVGTPDEVHDLPASPFVMSFVGESATLPVRIEDGSVRFGEVVLPVSPDGLADGAASLFVRPGDLRVAGAGDASVSGTIGLVRRTANGRRAEVIVDGTRSILEVDLPAEAAAQMGERIDLSIRSGRVFPSS